MSNESLGRRVGHLRGEARRCEIERVLLLWEGADQSGVHFCREQGISTQTLRRWLEEFGGRARRKRSATPAFIEVQAPHADHLYEIVLPSGASVRVPAGFDDTDLARLLAAAASC